MNGIMKDNSLPNIILSGSGWGLPAKESICINNVDEVLESHLPEDVIPILQSIESKTAQGKYAIGFLSYEASLAFGLPAQTSENITIPMIWFAVIDPRNVKHQPIPVARNSSNNPLTLQLSQDETGYVNTIKKIKQHILNGNTYQINYTMRACFTSDDFTTDVFHTLFHAQPVPYAALIETEAWSVLSLSPELFLSKTGNTICSAPMKGTYQRGRFLDEDKRHIEWLRNSEKDRAENIMIVDMMRNDLGKISCFGSVRVSDLFKIEPYRTVLQMTGTVEAELKSTIHLHEIMQAAFPAASVTGAPKHRTMKIIQDHENTPRGVYCGSIGIIKPGGDFTFNVAIRTLEKIGKHFTCGVGSGIVWDSEPHNEYDEIKTKTLFITQNQEQFQLIETLLLNEHSEYVYLDEHLARLESSAIYFSFPFHRDQIIASLTEYAITLIAPCVVRLVLDELGNPSFSSRAITAVPDAPTIILSSKQTDSNNLFYFHKTTRRDLYHTERIYAHQQGAFEVIFQNENGYLTEGSISNIFLLKDGKWKTPPIEDGLLAGVWRAKYLQEHHAVESHITLEDAQSAERIVIGNSVMGTVKVILK